MPIATSSVVEEGPIQRDGRRAIRFSFTDQTGREFPLYGYRKYPGSIDAETQRISLIVTLDAQILQEELDAAWALGLAGGDIDVVAWQHHTTAEIQRYWWRRFMNLFREGAVEPEDINELTEASVNAAPYYNKNTNPQISNFIDDPAWTNNAVGQALTSIAAVAVNIVQMTHTNPELEL